tara:strand:- start:932 stop:1138 length:207 start_codon:yes stop_codon:yes gene_type:complete
MHKDLYWKVEAFFFKNGEYQLQHFISGMTYSKAREYYWELHDTNEYAMLKMARLDGNSVWKIENKEAA